MEGGVPFDDHISRGRNASSDVSGFEGGSVGTAHNLSHDGVKKPVGVMSRPHTSTLKPVSNNAPSEREAA